MSNEITIQAKKYDDRIYKSWKGKIVFQDQHFIKITGIFAEEVNHPQLGVIKSGTISDECFWFNKGYNVFGFYEPDNTFRNFYCNITSLPIIDGNVLSYIDFDIDVIVSERLRIEILDMDEFEENAAKYKYPPAIKKIIKTNLDELLKLIEDRKFPFDIQF